MTIEKWLNPSQATTAAKPGRYLAECRGLNNEDNVLVLNMFLVFHQIHALLMQLQRIRPLKEVIPIGFIDRGNRFYLVL